MQLRSSQLQNCLAIDGPKFVMKALGIMELNFLRKERAGRN